MNTPHTLDEFAPLFRANEYSTEEQQNLTPFFTNLDKSVYVPLIFAPELIGALCSRTSRAAKDLRSIYLYEFVQPFLDAVRTEKDTDEDWAAKVKYGEELRWFIKFLQAHPILDIFSNPRARSFYSTWLAQYGDDSIAQMAGAHLVFCGISQVAIKHIEDQRIGLAPIEKSTRYVNYAEKINGRYLYYTDPSFAAFGLKEEYEHAMNGLFDTYIRLMPRMIEWLAKNFPNEKPSVIEKKAFDTLRGLLPSSTLSMVSFFGNGQAFEYMIARSAKHPLGEIRWAAQRALEELYAITPSFLRRLADEQKQETAEAYQKYLAEKGRRIAPHVLILLKTESDEDRPHVITANPHTKVQLIEYDPHGEAKVITGILFSAPNNHRSWDEVFERVKRMSVEEKKGILDAYCAGRTQRWQKIGRAFENAYVRFEIVMNIGAWRDLHRHRMLTQQRQNFSCHHGFDIPQEVTAAGLEETFRSAIEQTETVYQKIERHDPDLAQYATTLAHRLRFMQWENLRQSFWQIELRSIPEGHPDYRKIVQEKFRLLEKVYPLIAERILVNLGDYDFARRGQEEKIQKKAEMLSQQP